MPGSGQSWADLYPNGQPPVFPLPNSSRAFPAAQAAAIGFAREFLGLEDPQLSVSAQSEDDAEILVRADGAAEASRLTLRKDDLGWVVVRVDGQGINTGLPAPTGAGEPPGVTRTIDLSGASPAATAMVDLVDLAERPGARPPVGRRGHGPPRRPAPPARRGRRIRPHRGDGRGRSQLAPPGAGGQRGRRPGPARLSATGGALPTHG